jgi:hypothetical protein
MRLAIMQPYFFPYLGYYSLLDYVDKFILLDSVQYRRKSWMNRNRILKPKSGWQYINVGAVKPDFGESIAVIKLSSDLSWKKKVLAQLAHYKKIAPYYFETMDLVESVLFSDIKYLSDLNKKTIEVVAGYVGIACDIIKYTESCRMIDDKVNGPDEWALEIATEEGALEYVNPPGGMSLFNPQRFIERGIKLSFLENNISSYKQRNDLFEPSLSIIDVLMFNSAQKVKYLVSDYKVLG